MEKILVVNAGSSTIKWKLFLKKDFTVIAEGVADRIFVDGVIETKYNGKKHTREISLNNHDDASQEIYKDLKDLNIIDDVNEVTNIGYRVVQGGTIFTDTTLVGPKEIEQIDELSTLAPLHNPGAVQAMKAFSKIFVNAQGSATFDTSFHSTLPPVNYTYPINQKLAKKHNIRKYGMHGTSHKFITEKMVEITGKEKVNFVNLHIGNGASLCAVKDSKSIDTSMGLTPLAGIMMGTRSGDIDPSIHAFVCKNEGITIDEFDTILNKESGLKGVSGISQDMRDIVSKANEGNEQAKFTLDLYAQKIADYSAIYLNKIGKDIDGIVFTAGVGENAYYIRKAVINKINVLNFEIDDKKNEGKIGEYSLISTDSSLPIYVIRTDEELMIAKEAIKVSK